MSYNIKPLEWQRKSRDSNETANTVRGVYEIIYSNKIPYPFYWRLEDRDGRFLRNGINYKTNWLAKKAANEEHKMELRKFLTEVKE